jgi:hypothetical protein
MCADETLIDIYTRNDPTGYRIYMTGFDFSCLGEAKGMLAGENMRLLVTMLSEVTPSMRTISDHSQIKHLLGDIWEVESRKESQGARRAGFASKVFGSVQTTNDLSQFTKYSRMQWHLL